MYVEEQLTEKNMKFVSFHEPDIGGELTAVALIPCEEAKQFCKQFKLALKNYAPIAQSGRAAVSKTANAGSNPARSANGEVAQLIERRDFKAEVEGVSPSLPTILHER
jgi:hypothetical protein